VKLDGERLSRLFPDGVVAEEARPTLAVEELFPEEKAQIARAVDKRKAEYATARVLARRALARLGAEATPIVNDEERCPQWPEGVIGSITHTKGYCGVVLARRGEAVDSLGVDVENLEPVKEALYDKICSEAELARLESVPSQELGTLVRVVFSAKEAFYKAQYPITRQYLGFHAADVVLDVEAGRFEVVLTREAGRFASGRRFEGRVTLGEGLIVSALSI
jgi:4'-phosphopantetheinyl transferase EntD